MPTLTLADALAEVETLGRRIDKKQQLVAAYLLREQRYRDPLAPEGGSAVVLAGELAALDHLHERRVLLRRLIQNAYERTLVTFGDQTRALADWLVWRREVATRHGGFLKALSMRIQRARRQAARAAQARGVTAADRKPPDLVIHINEQELARQQEEHEELLGYLTGQLALRNATLTIDIPEDEACKSGLEEHLEELLQRAKGPAVMPLDRQAPWSSYPQLCQLARDPVKKIAAIKMYRELTGVSLMEAKAAVEAFQAGQE
jgi:hypothetical protein